ncbi:MAG: hypothetical protein PHR77_08400 [Kiritimatiellae bacterium]|nr:hypothetical protein [Kiritimatiellia bacterium]MDD5520527.1 hypothetical protein [Kiritimatiellia bacterium]
MKCPNCQADFEYTWTIYFKNPLGRIKCPLCLRRFRLKSSAKYWSMLILSLIIFSGFPIIGMLALGVNDGVTWLTYIGLGILIVLPIDKLLDQRTRKTETMEMEDKEDRPSSAGDTETSVHEK